MLHAATQLTMRACVVVQVPPTFVNHQATVLVVEAVVDMADNKVAVEAMGDNNKAVVDNDGEHHKTDNKTDNHKDVSGAKQ